MILSRSVRTGLAVALSLALIAGVVAVVRSVASVGRTHAVAYFANSNGLYAGDEVRILGVPVGKIDSIEAQPDRVKISFWFDDKVHVPADAKAVILSQQLITSRAIQLTPAYDGGPAMTGGAVIPLDRTVVPVEFDDLREQLEKLTDALQPTQPDGESPLGAFINTAAENLRGQGANIRDTVIQLSQAFSALGDHSNDIFSTIKNLSILVNALHSSANLMKHLNRNLASVTALLANDPNEVADAVAGLNSVSDDVRSFFPEIREAVGTTSDRLASVSKAIVDSLDDIKQTLHVAPTAFQNLANIYQPAQASLTGALAINNFSNPITFLCGAIQAASRLNNEQSAKLCAQYLAPIIKNRQFNFPPLGENLFVGASARPNEITYSEDWMRPDYIPPQPQAPPSPDAVTGSPDGPPLAAEATTSTDPTAGLSGLMVPPGVGP
jgi:phospholipid/cholesterol/gamma-HCH transport system substrate-binding protein